MTSPTQIDASIASEITRRLDTIEADHTVRVLYASEAGSRAWGMASPDSDYDVRFIYVHPADWYLSIDLQRRDDTIDVPITDALDMHGWDLKKALHLFRTSNPPLLEWLQSPLVYREAEATMQRWRSMIPTYYTPIAAGYHYLHMAQSIHQSDLTGDGPVSVKSYLYVLRALLAVRWMERREDPVPVRIERLVAVGVEDNERRTAIRRLLNQKQTGAERHRGPRWPTLDAFIADEFERLRDTRFASADGPKPLAPLNAFFRDVVRRTSPELSAP